MRVRRRWGWSGRYYEATFNILLDNVLAVVTTTSAISSEVAEEYADRAHDAIRRYR